MAGRRVVLGLGLAVAFAACAPSVMEQKCRQQSPDVTPADCWAAAYDEGYLDGSDDGDQVGYDDGYAQCEADHDTGDTGDSGDTG